MGQELHSFMPEKLDRCLGSCLILMFFPFRAAAQSKLSHYTDAIKDCEKAIAIDSKYSKAYGRMG